MVAAADTAPADNASDKQGSWAQVIGAVKSPLGFFALALLAVDGAFPTLYGLSTHTTYELEWIATMMGGMFLATIVAVVVLVKIAPVDLVETAAERGAKEGARQALSQVGGTLDEMGNTVALLKDQIRGITG